MFARREDILKPTTRPQLAIIIPACNEEACIGPVLDELLAAIDRDKPPRPLRIQSSESAIVDENAAMI